LLSPFEGVPELAVAVENAGREKCGTAATREPRSRESSCVASLRAELGVPPGRAPGQHHRSTDSTITVADSADKEFLLSLTLDVQPSDPMISAEHPVELGTFGIGTGRTGERIRKKC